MVGAIQKNPTGFPKSRVAAAQTCLHKLGYNASKISRKISSIRTNPTKNDLDKFLKLFLEATNGKFDLYIKPDSLGPVRVTDKGDIYQAVDQTNGTEPKTWPKESHIELNKIKHIDFSQLIEEYLGLFKTVTKINAHGAVKKEIKSALHTIVSLPDGLIPNAPRTGHWTNGPDWNTGNKAPGLHAEVQAVNDALVFLERHASKPKKDHITVATFHLAGNEDDSSTTDGKLRKAKRLTDFPACNNCTQILSPLIRIPTGSMLDKS